MLWGERAWSYSQDLATLACEQWIQSVGYSQTEHSHTIFTQFEVKLPQLALPVQQNVWIAFTGATKLNFVFSFFFFCWKGLHSPNTLCSLCLRRICQINPAPAGKHSICQLPEHFSPLNIISGERSTCLVPPSSTLLPDARLTVLVSMQPQPAQATPTTLPWGRQTVASL